MADLPSKAAIQKLITSHPDGVKGEPLAVAWSTHQPGTLVIIDCIGHKLIFPDALAPNKQDKTQPGTDNKLVEKQLRSTNKPRTSGRKTTNKPGAAKA